MLEEASSLVKTIVTTGFFTYSFWGLGSIALNSYKKNETKQSRNTEKILIGLTVQILLGRFFLREASLDGTYMITTTIVLITGAIAATSINIFALSEGERKSSAIKYLIAFGLCGLVYYT